MLRIDFNQRFLDHRSILVYVKKLGALTEPEFSQLFDDISQLRTVKLPNGRTVHLRYTRHISHQFIEWGSFHMHKKLLGILSLAKLLHEDVSAIKTAHESLKTWYGNTSLDSRCFVLGCDNIPEEENKRDREYVFLSKGDVMTEIQRQVGDYALSLFLVLEGKRMDKSLEKPEKFAFLRSPLDSEVLVDAESRNRKQCIGRMKKYIGDLCLVAGVPEEAIFHYSVAIVLLRSVGDMLWTSGSLEGLCAASLLCQDEHKITSPERPSLQLDISQLSTAGPVNGTGADGDEFKIGSVIPLTDVEIVEKSEEIFQSYEKSQKSKVMAVEARFKYARFFLSKKRNRDVSTTLQDVLAIELTFKLSDAEKIQLYSAMAIMYEDIHFMRKAAFFTRKAARHCTSQHLPPQGWTAACSSSTTTDTNSQSYNLMRNALDGYKIHFDSDNIMEKQKGWPDLKVQLMTELIEMSKELLNSNIPIRHISYLIQTMHPHIEENEMQELINSLEKLASTSQDHFSLVQDLVLNNSDVLPPVSLTELPVVRDLKVNALASHLRPILSPSSPSPVKTPFIFSMLNKTKRKNHKNVNPAVRWVEGDVGEVAMQVHNPMPFDIKISKMTLLTEGVPFQAFPSCLALSNDNMSHPFMLLGIPEGPGQLEITGYSVELFGIQSNCSIRQTILDKQFNLPLVVTVTPKLPLVQFQSAISAVKSFVNSSHRGSSLTLNVSLHNGQSISGPIVVENVGKIPVENFTITLLSSFKSEKTLVTLDQDEVMQSLPIPVAATSQFNLTFHGHLPDPLQDGGTLNWSGKLKVSYSGGEAWKLGISRQAAVDIRIEVVPSLHCVNYSVVAIEKGDGDHFEISMDVCNKTKYDVEWRYQMNTGMTYPDKTNILAADHSIRATLELEKFDLSISDPKKTDCDLCSEKLQDLVKLRWEIPELQIVGLLNLDGLTLTEELVNIVGRSHLIFEMSVNGVKISKGDSVPSSASVPVFLTVTICNSSDKVVNASILNIEPFEVGEDGLENFDVKQKICWLGATSTLLPAIKAKSSAEHTCGFLFLTPGKFFINVKCFERVNTDVDQPFRDRARVIKGDSPSNRRSRSSRTESFTESLLLRQRTQSTPLAHFAYSLLFDVQEDPGTIIEEIDSGVVCRVSEKEFHVPEKEIHIPENDSHEPGKNLNLPEKNLHGPVKEPRVSEKDLHEPDNDPSILEKDSAIPEKEPRVWAKVFHDPNVNKQLDSRNVECNEGEIGITGRNVGHKEDNKCEVGVTYSNVTGNLLVKMVGGKDTEDKIVFMKDKLCSETGDSSTENNRVSNSRENADSLEQENLGVNLEILPENYRIKYSIDLQETCDVVDMSDGGTNVDITASKCIEATGENSYSMPQRGPGEEVNDISEGLTTEEIELDFREADLEEGKMEGENPGEGPETKPKERFRDETSDNMSEKLNNTSSKEFDRVASTQPSTSEIKDDNEMTDLAYTTPTLTSETKGDNEDGEESEETLLRSPSVKERIMLFNAS